MAVNRRELIQMMGGATAALTFPKLARAQAGPFLPTRESLHAYRIPEWYRDAKFGIWAHWGLQCQPEHGDWYARSIYMEGSDDCREYMNS